MARIRTIKPEFWTSAQVVECSLKARLLFIGLWNFCDDAGRIEDSPRQIKMKVFPGDDFTADDIHDMLNELSVNGLIERYHAEGKRYLQVTGWHHQKINRPNPSNFPAPPPSDHGALTEPHLPEGKGKEGKGKECSSAHARDAAALAEGQPDQKPEPEPEPRPERQRFMEVGDRVCEIAGIDPTKFYRDYSPAIGWLSAGFDPERDIYPAVEMVCQRKRAKQPGWTPKGLAYFTDAIRERHQAANEIPDFLDRRKPNGHDAEAARLERLRAKDADWWRHACRDVRDRRGGKWPVDELMWPPGDERCLCPPDIRREFGLEPIEQEG